MGLLCTNIVWCEHFVQFLAISINVCILRGGAIVFMLHCDIRWHNYRPYLYIIQGNTNRESLQLSTFLEFVFLSRQSGRRRASRILLAYILWLKNIYCNILIGLMFNIYLIRTSCKYNISFIKEFNELRSFEQYTLCIILWEMNKCKELETCPKTRWTWSQSMFILFLCR